MARTHWRDSAGGWEFLGAFPDDHKQNPRSGCVYGAVIVVPGTAQEFLDRLGERVHLVNPPAAIRKRLAANQEFTIPFDQLDGFLK